MSSIIQFISILTLSFFLQYLILTVRVNFHTPPSAPIDNIALYEHCYSGIHVMRQDSTHSAPKLRKLAFGRLNTIATAVTIVITLLNIVVYKLREIHEANLREKYKPSEQSCRRFLLADILSATKNFDDSLIVGQGGFGKVYRGVIDDGTITVAIKRLNPMSKQGAPEFWAEIEMLSRIRHSNIVSLIGYCDDCDEMILIYEYMVHGTLADNIQRNTIKSALPWAQRLKICIGAAHGLDYLHTGIGDQNRIIHRDIKSSNILLGENWTAKVSDFGMAKIGPTNQLHTHVSTNVKGTFGYVDPEYFLTRRLTRKSDVYAFGVVLFEVLCGRRAVDLSLDLEQRGLAGWAQQCIKEGKLDQIIDLSLRGQILSDSLTVFAQIADQCLHMFSTKRPTMAEVVVSLELALRKQERTDFSIYEEEFFINTGGDCDNHETAESSIVVINGDCNNLENADSSVLRQDEQIEGIMQLDDASNKKSRVNPARRTSFSKMVRKFFFGTGHVISGEVDQTIAFGLLKRFAWRELKLATDNFSKTNVVGHGYSSIVYKGLLADNTKVAVKRLRDYESPGGNAAFQCEVEAMSAANHRNLLRPIGFCITRTERLLVYPFMQNSSVAYRLRGIIPGEAVLDWPTRKQVALGTARGFEYIHEHCNPKIIHRDVTAGKVFLDENFEAVVGGFSLVKLVDVRDTHVTTAVRGTIGHIAPEYLSGGKVSERSDVFGYGIMLLELVTGQRAFDLAHIANKNDELLLDHVKRLQREKRLDTIVDSNLQREYDLQEAEMMIQVALLCTHFLPEDRLAMSEVVRMLEGEGLAERWEEWQHVEVT